MDRSTSRTAGLVAGLAALTLGLAACGGGSPEPAAPPAAAGPEKIQVVASTDVWGSVAQAVGGDRVAVTPIIDSPDKDPHEYESTPADAATVGKAKLIVSNGGGYDEFMTRLVAASGNKAPVVDAVTVSGLQPAGEQEQHAPGEEHSHGEFNEHVWYSLPTVQKVAQAVATELGRADPSGAATYTGNAQRFDAGVAQLTTRAAAIGTAHPGATAAVTEPVPDYLLDAATLRNVTPEAFSEAVEEGNDPPAAVLQETLAVFAAQPPVNVLVLNAQTQSPTTDQVRQAATQAGVPVVEMTETLPAGTTDYLTWMGGQIDRLSAALDRR